MDNDKISEVDMLRWQVAVSNVTMATQSRELLLRDMMAKYGRPGDTELNWAADGTIVRAPVAAPETPVEAPPP